MAPKVIFKGFTTCILQILCCCCLLGTVSAQNYKPLRTNQTKPKTPYYNLQEAIVQENTRYSIQPDFGFTAIALSISLSESFAGAYLIAAQDTLFLREDAHQSAEDSVTQSQLLIFDEVQSEFHFYSSGIRGRVSFSLVNAEAGRTAASARLQQNRQAQRQAQSQTCEQPEIIPQSVWRSGLPAPSYQRAETSVQHVIVHHSAGSNSSTDYLNTVRNIYLFHTQDRGWSDIGYNFLIAQDGSIFQGRSFGDASLDTDNIRGAHFCGQNSGTMGICMLGNFNTAVPSDTSISSLTRLISWKLYKESLDPLASFRHPANADLGVIAAHRNGCATECPGDNLYVMLDRIRLAADSYIEDGCEQSPPLAFEVYPVPAGQELYVSLPEDDMPESFWLIDALGQRIAVVAYPEQQNWLIQTEGLRAGFYVLQVVGTGFSYERKILVQ
jgi:hypothetical protein